MTRLRRALGLPGMVVLQFAFDPDDPRGPHRLENHARDVVAYTGTHDTDTAARLVGRRSRRPAAPRSRAALDEAGIDDERDRVGG